MVMEEYHTAAIMYLKNCEGVNYVMHKKIIRLLVMSCIIFVVAGCGNAKTSKAYTFSVETGDKIKISLDTSDKYNLTSDMPFVISCDGEILSQGTFITSEVYEQYMEAVNTDEKAKLIDSGIINSNEYIFWSYNESEFNYAILVGDSKTGVLIGNNVSQESAKDCFDRITLSIED